MHLKRPVPFWHIPEQRQDCVSSNVDGKRIAFAGEPLLNFFSRPREKLDPLKALKSIVENVTPKSRAAKKRAADAGLQLWALQGHD